MKVENEIQECMRNNKEQCIPQRMELWEGLYNIKNVGYRNIEGGEMDEMSRGSHYMLHVCLKLKVRA